ncbi:MAG: SAF domain-containing protein, partial [Planctomycetota bacterium]
MHQKARRSLVAACAIPKGTRIEPDMITIKRPGYGIPPKFLRLVVGRAARQDIEADDVITWEVIG